MSVVLSGFTWDKFKFNPHIPDVYKFRKAKH